MTKVQTSIILVHYKYPKILYNCIDSVINCSQRASYEIIVVDNSVNETLKIEINRKLPRVNYIKSTKNLGYGGGNNLGARYARGKYLFFLNPDTELKPRALNNLASFLENNQKAAIAAPNLIHENGKIFEHIGTADLTPARGVVALSFLNKLFPKSHFSRDYWLKTLPKDKLREVGAIPGTAFMIRKNIFERVGGFDEKFFLYFEETDLCKRVKELSVGKFKEDWKIYITPRSEVIHFWFSKRRRSDKLQKIFERSRFYYFKKHYGSLTAIFIEIFARFSKWHVALFGTLVLAGFLRFYMIHELMPFIGDFAWYYLQARDMILTGKIPQVGIPSSVPILRQGALWTWILAASLWLGNFNPVSGAFLTASLGVLTIVGVYLLTTKWFGKRIGFIASAVTSVSPYIVTFDRIPFQTALIFPMTTLIAYSFWKVYLGERKHYFFLGLWLAILFQFELAGFILFPIILVVFFWQRIKFRPQDILSFLSGGVIGLAPFIIHDIKQGVYIQTAGFLAWFVGKVVEGFLSILTGARGGLVFAPAIRYLKEIVFAPSATISLILLAGSLVYCLKLLIGKAGFTYKFVFLWLVLAFIGFLVRGVYSQAYMPLLFLPIVISLSVFFNLLIEGNKTLGIGLLILVIIGNVSYFYNQLKNPQGTTFKQQLEISEYIVNEVAEKNYKLVYIGPNDEFEAGDNHWEYLLWWKGKEPVSKAEEKIVIVEYPNTLGSQYKLIRDYGYVKIARFRSD